MKFPQDAPAYEWIAMPSHPAQFERRDDGAVARVWWARPRTDAD